MMNPGRIRSQTRIAVASPADIGAAAVNDAVFARQAEISTAQR